MSARTITVVAGALAATLALSGCGPSYSLASGPQYRAAPLNEPSVRDRRVEAHRSQLRTMDRSPARTGDAD